MPKPVLLYDGDCGFCRRWVERWKALTGGAVEYAAAQEAGGRFPQIPPEAFARAVQFVAADGAVAEGALAAFKALEHAPAPYPLLSRAYARLPPFARACEAVYRLVAANRAAASRLTRLLWGDDLAPPSYEVGRVLFVRGVALCYLLAFASFALQWEGLVGARGISPAAELSERVRAALGAGAYVAMPTVHWLIGTSDAALGAVPWLGAAAAAGALAGFFPTALLAACWVLYLSVYSVGSVFTGFQWDVLLLEAGVLAALAAPGPSGVVVWLVRWLWFRLLFSAGAVKLLSGDPSWWDLSALTFHFETQPLPHALSWYAHSLPALALKAGCAAMFFIELVLPFAAFLPRRPRLAAFAGANALMLLIALTGNYNFFNLLAVVLSVVLLDDRQWGRLGRRLPAPGAPAGRARRWAVGLYAAFVVPTSLAAGLLRAHPPAAGSRALVRAAQAGGTFHLVNAYGLFAVMTRPRREIVLEGSRDGLLWEPYELRWKPGDPARRPGWVQPHQPRLDWQMWFAALAPYEHNPWFLLLVRRLLQGSEPVRGLFARDPFGPQPPRFIRGAFYEYSFARSGRAWWERRFLGPYCPVLTLNPDGTLAAVELRAGR